MAENNDRNHAEFNVPIIDISPFVDGESFAEPEEARREVARSIDEACRTVGFMQVVGHGVPDIVVNGLTDALDGFFGQELDVKKRVRTEPGINRGYSPPKSERLSLSLGVESATGMNDFFEAFNIGAQSSDHPELSLPEADYPENVWPEEESESMVGFRVALETWFGEARRVAQTLTIAFEQALGISPGAITGLTDHSIDVLRTINYALEPGERVELDGELNGMGEHTDYGIVTVLWADRVAGLQVLGDDGNWHDVEPEPGALLVNLGDVMARLTNDQWKSTLHRVKPPVIDGTIRRRRSAAFFHDGNVDAVVGPLPEMIDDEHPALYESMTVGEHVAAKLAGSRGLKSNDSDTDREAARVLASIRS